MAADLLSCDVRATVRSSAHAKVTPLQGLVVGQAHWTSMASRTAYSTSTPMKPTLSSGYYLRNRFNSDIGVLGYIGIVQHKEHPPEVWSVPPVTPRIYTNTNTHTCNA